MVPPASTAQFGGSVSVRIARTSSYTATGRGPGETSGPAVAFTLTLTNGSRSSVSLANANVTADYGRAHTPAGTLSGPPASPWSGAVAPGRTANGTYCFSIPTNQRTLVTLTISYDPTKPVVVISGPVR